MLEHLSRTRRNLALALIGAGVLWFVWSIRAVVNPLLLGYLAAYILHPMVVRLQERGRSRRAAVNLIFAGGFSAAVVISLALFLQGKALVEDVVSNDEVRADVSAKIEATRTRLEEATGLSLPELDLQDVYGLLQSALAGPTVVVADEEDPGLLDPAAAREGLRTAGEVSLEAATSLWGRLRALVGNIIGLGGLLFLVPLYCYYLLFELGRLHSAVQRYLPHRDRERLSDIGRQIGRMLAAFFRGRLVVCLLKGLFLSVGLLLAGVDYAFLFGMSSGFLSIIPVVGPLVGFALAALVAVIEFTPFQALLRTGIVFAVGEAFEGYVLMPKVIGDSLRMNEVEVLFYLMAGGAAFGMFGILVALPVAAVAKILIKELVLPALARFADEERPDESPPPTAEA